jgi:hypothetical protein
MPESPPVINATLSRGVTRRRWLPMLPQQETGSGFLNAKGNGTRCGKLHEAQQNIRAAVPLLFASENEETKFFSRNPTLQCDVAQTETRADSKILFNALPGCGLSGILMRY